MPDNVKKAELEEVIVKSPSEHALNAAKYVATAATISTAAVGIIMFAKPEWKPIESYILSLLTVALNVGIAYFIQKGNK